MRVALVHHWLVEQGGGERVVEALCRLYPDADLFTNMYRPAGIDGPLASRAVRTTLVDHLPYAPSLLPAYVPLMPMALSRLDLRGYDLVISSESGPSKGMRIDARALHVCYCHSPMRYVWDMEDEYVAAAPALLRPVMRAAAWYLRRWDRKSSRRLDLVISNSHHTQARVRHAWQRDSIVIAPPVDVDRFAQPTRRGDHFVFLGRLVHYKRADLAVQAANRSGHRLIVIGEGAELPKLRRMAGPTVQFLGRAKPSVVNEVLGSARALLFPGEEDFGIVPVEAMAAGVPVIAYGRGGVLDTVLDGVTGILHAQQSVEAIVAAMEQLDKTPDMFSADVLRAHARNFSHETFATRFADAIDEAWEFRHQRSAVP